MTCTNMQCAYNQMDQETDEKENSSPRIIRKLIAMAIRTLQYP